MTDARTSSAQQGKSLRRGSILRKDDSFRPGMSSPAPQDCMTKALDLRFRFPLPMIEPSDEQRSQLGEVKTQLARYTFVSGLFVYQDAYEVGLKFHVEAPALTEDRLLTYVFLETRTVWEGKPLFTEGFCDQRPGWEALKADFVADRGYFSGGAPHDSSPVTITEATSIS